MGRARAELLVKTYKNYDLHVSREGFQYTLGNMAIRRNLREPEKTKLSHLSRIIIRNGLLTSIWEKLIHFNWLKLYLKHYQYRLEQQIYDEIYDPTKTIYYNESIQKQSIITRDMLSFTYIYLIVVGNVFIIFILELLLYHLDLARMSSKQT